MGTRRRGFPHRSTYQKKRGFQKGSSRKGQPYLMTAISSECFKDNQWELATQYEKREFISRDTTNTRIKKGHLLGIRYRGRIWVKETKI